MFNNMHCVLLSCLNMPMQCTVYSYAYANMQSIFIGGIVIAGFGAAGMLSALTASDWEVYASLLLSQITNLDHDSTKTIKFVTGIIHCYRACQFLIGTSVCSLKIGFNVHDAWLHA